MKLLLDETGTHQIELAVREATALVTAGVAYVELRAALAAAHRAGRVVRSREELLLDLEQLLEGTVRIIADAALIRLAGELAERFALRGYDAVHLAALTLAGDPGEVQLACWDSQLRRAAGQLGYSLLPETSVTER